jgi:hypothetical protein
MEFKPVNAFSAPHPAQGSTSLNRANTVAGSNQQPLNHLKNITFAPMGSGDVFSQCININLSRKPEKGLVPILPRNE